MEVDLGGLGLAEVMTGALQEGDRLQGQPLEGVFFNDNNFMSYFFVSCFRKRSPFGKRRLNIAS